MLKRTNNAQVQGGRVDQKQFEPKVKLTHQDFLLCEMEAMTVDVHEEARSRKYHLYRMAHLCKDEVKKWARKGKLFKDMEIHELKKKPEEVKQPEVDFFSAPEPA